MRYLIDSSAWIEYFEGSERGSELARIMNSENEIITLPLNIAEVISKVTRKNGKSETAYNAMINRSSIIDITPKMAKIAGIMHAEEKKLWSSFSLADAFMIVTARIFQAILITTDNHFKKFKEVKII